MQNHKRAGPKEQSTTQRAGVSPARGARPLDLRLGLDLDNKVEMVADGQVLATLDCNRCNCGIGGRCACGQRKPRGQGRGDSERQEWRSAISAHADRRRASRDLKKVIKGLM